MPEPGCGLAKVVEEAGVQELQEFRSCRSRHENPECEEETQVALAWLLARKPWIVPIHGTTNLHRLQENCGAASVELSPEDLRELESVASKIIVPGARYPENLQKLVGR